MFQVTASWIYAHKTANGGWTKRQLSALSIPWPPERGWIDRAVQCTRYISEEQRLQFESDSHTLVT